MGDSDTSLLLSLKHPQPFVRMAALEHLMSIITNKQVWQEVRPHFLLAVSENNCCSSRATRICSEQQHNLTDTFLKDAVTDRLKDDVPEVVSATLKVVKVSEDEVERFPLQAGCCCLLFAFTSLQLLYDVLEPEHIVSCLLSVLHRAEPSAEQWSVKPTKLGFNSVL